MDKFIVSARKYRPQNFSTVVGQSHITTTLKNAINNNQLAHAFLFCGPRGVGKTTCARILAKTINCENKTGEGEACNTCNSCVSFDNGSSMNIHELDAASNNSVDDIRSLVEQVRFAPQAGDYKVYIVDEVHMLSAAAFNAFLKTLEEPPPYAIFILATTEKHKILPTILSRCQIFDFKRITTNDTVEHIQEICDKEEITAEKTALHIIAQKSEGCMRDALSILDKIVSFTGGKITYTNTLEHLNILDEDYYFSMLDHMRKQQLSDALLLFDTINQKGFEGDTFLEGFTEFVRNLLVSKEPKAAILLDVAEDFKQKYLQVSLDTDTAWMLSALNLLTDSNIGYKQARNKKLFVEMTLIKLSYLQQALEISAGDGGISKKKLTDSAKPVAFKALPIIRVKDDKPVPVAEHPAPKAASLVIEEERTERPAPVSAPAPAQRQQPATPAPTTTLPGGSMGTLGNIRAKLAEKNKVVSGPKPLLLEELKSSLAVHIEKLFAEKNNLGASTIKAAALSIVDDNTFTIIVDNTLQQKIIEAERSGLIHHLQDHFNNRILKYSIIIDEKERVEEPEAKTLNRKQQYALMTEQYPLIKELRERLRLEVD
ncbi:DNA polymerase III subunit gamma/tau [Ferruginibacter sp. HRS2-29]|uniref:DNA polymerase III subunit gamma/tau n=1 Tax=Ferruginibacter sp. HRS2-29 TaxID=2487334 RepID=UPI0020CF1CDD|nr:DNA polymerase III subunit gamma/tau [Ferruginibacter sp. HRS2-29]MCP9752169.1 DNA polymerase III subunit gamma/tau [Ferruginibacter sp. HRS2-29]